MPEEVPIKPVEVDFDDAETRFGPLPEDAYQVLLDDLTARQSKKGEVYWNAKLIVQFGEHEGRFIWDSWFPNSPRGLGRIKEVICPAFGFDANGRKQLDPDAFIGKRVIVHTKIEEFQSQKRTRVHFDGYKPVGSFTSNDAPERVQL